ncbi:TonB C-terminal domain-containing protein [Lysobacter sp. CA199]|uniref:TonB C-terminal domain-containing protein n=1 Tax=Lysobacter sp. CA199 TaxID=3455608 RepID=UPI003F8CFE62
MPAPNTYGQPSRFARALGLVGALGVFAVLAWLVWSLMQDSRPTSKRMPPRITQVMLPPPPPPPPPPEPEKVPEEEKLVENTPFEALDTPKEDSPEPPGDPLTAEAGPGSNEFGLQAGDGGGTRIGGKGGGGNPYAGYAAMVQRTVQQYLQQSEKTRKGRYSATVAMWLNADGTIQRSQVVVTTGKAELDAAIVAALQGRSLPQAPPAEMPQPINLRIGAVSPG